MKKKMLPVHPGEILFEEFLKPLNITQEQLSNEIKVPVKQVNEILKGNCRLTADNALRLARYFKMTPHYWMGLQVDYEIDLAQDKLEETINKEVSLCPAFAVA